MFDPGHTASTTFFPDPKWHLRAFAWIAIKETQTKTMKKNRILIDFAKRLMWTITVLFLKYTLDSIECLRPPDWNMVLCDSFSRKNSICIRLNRIADIIWPFLWDSATFSHIIIYLNFIELIVRQIIWLFLWDRNENRFQNRNCIKFILAQMFIGIKASFD